MDDKFFKLYSLPEQLYVTGSPIVISAGALLRNNITNKLLAQLKIRNIQEKTIKSIKLHIQPLDQLQQPIGEAVIYEYMDLAAARDAEFGQQTPIPIPDIQTRAYEVAVLRVIFSDNSIWEGSTEIMRPLKPGCTAKEYFKTTELVKQYHLEFGSQSEYIYAKDRDLWFCSCGALNHAYEAHCHQCKLALESLENLDEDMLKERCTFRVGARIEDFGKQTGDSYTKLFSLPNNLYATGCPIIISEGTLLKNNVSGKLLTRLQMLNIQEESIRAVTVRLQPLDQMNHELDDAFDYEYIDLNVGRDESFGEKMPVVFPDGNTCAYTIKIARVIFENGTVWESSDEPVEALKEQQIAAVYFKNEELVKQYKAVNGQQCRFVYEEDKDLWLCACGAVNKKTEKYCHKCELEGEELKNETVESIQKCYEDKEEKQRQIIEEQKKTKRNKKVKLAAIGIIICVIAGAMGYFNTKAEIMTGSWTYHVHDNSYYDDADDGRLLTINFDNREVRIQEEMQDEKHVYVGKYHLIGNTIVCNVVEKDGASDESYKLEFSVGPNSYGALAIEWDGMEFIHRQS